MVLRQKISHNISTKSYHSIPFLIWSNVGTCTWIYYIRRGYTDLSHLFFFKFGTSSPNLANLYFNDIFIFLEVDGRLFIIDNFKKGRVFVRDAIFVRKHVGDSNEIYLAATEGLIWWPPQE